MAYSNLYKFYKSGDSDRLMIYLSRRGFTARRLSRLKWNQVRSGGRIWPLRLKGERGRRLVILKLRRRGSAVPYEYLFYKEAPSTRNPKGVRYTEREVWEICGEPHLMLLTKLRWFATIKLSARFKSLDIAK